LPSQISREAAKEQQQFFKKAWKKRGQKHKKDFFGRMKKALIFALPIEKRETKKLLTSTVDNSRSA
jgi:hypothetical protein